MVSSHDKIEKCKLLLVGAGGIGCEVLKNLTLAGFKNIDAVDMDTIDVSNLNRQFLFNKTHVGQSKALVAIDQAKTHYCPSKDGIQLRAFHKSIMSSEFDIDFFREYTFVINALDNRAARSHVNRMCLAAEVPLIESGTAGYTGQSKLIKSSLTACYECEGIQREGRTYPTCTIRNTPSQPIHCIVWAKHLFHQLFGEDDPDNDVSPQFDNDETQQKVIEEQDQRHINGHKTDNSNLVHSKPTEEKPDNSIQDSIYETKKPQSTRQWAESNDYDPMLLAHKLYDLDVKYLLSMENLWKNRVRPRPLDCLTIMSQSLDESNAHSSKSISEDSLLLDDQKLWSLKKCVSLFSYTVNQLRDRMNAEGHLIWDKDDDIALHFVVAASNLRSECFNIERKSPFDVKSLAGNIVPAISSTNSIIGGLIVLTILRLLRTMPIGTEYRSLPDEARNELLKNLGKVCYLNYTSLIRKDLISSFECSTPEPNCLACSKGRRVEVEISLSFDDVTMGDFIEKIVIQTFHFVCPDISIDDESGTIVWSKDEEEEGDPETDSIKKKKLSQLIFVRKPKTRLIVVDLLQDKEMSFCLLDEHLDQEKHKNFFHAKLNGKEI